MQTDIPTTTQPQRYAEPCVCERAPFGEMHDCPALPRFDGEEMCGVEEPSE